MDLHADWRDGSSAAMTGIGSYVEQMLATLANLRRTLPLRIWAKEEQHGLCSHLRQDPGNEEIWSRVLIQRRASGFNLTNR